MHRVIESSFRWFNNNSKGENKNDCVCRSMSLAFGVEYSQMYKELLRYQREEGMRYKSRYGIIDYLEKYKGLKVVHAPRSSTSTLIDPEETLQPTVEKFCEEHPTGTYLILCGKKRLTEHMVCVIDGDYYDTWDSGDNLVFCYFEVKGEKTSLLDTEGKDGETPIINQVLDAVYSYISMYVEHLIAKSPWTGATLVKDVIHSTSAYIEVTLDYKYWEEYGLDMYHKYGVTKELSVRVNPHMSVEDNIAAQKKKLHTEVREFLWQERKDVQDELRRKTVTPNPEFTGSETLLFKLPSEVIPYVTEIQDLGPADSDYERSIYRYMVEMYSQEGDPRKDKEPYVTFYSDNFQDIQRQIKRYIKDFKRYNWDY